MSTIINKSRLASGISTAAVAVALCVAQPAYAQSELGTLQGHVDGARAGEQVVAVDTHTGQRSVGRVDAKGNYVILGVRPSDYRITAGGQTQEATLQVGQTVTVDFVPAAPSGGGRNIVVTGRRSSQPAQAQTVATNITPAQIENLPQNSRNFLSFATLAPGITLSNPSGAVQLQAGALNADHSNVLLDGMSFKNPINHGGMFGQNFGDFGNPFPQIAIQEYQVQTQNFGAEVGQSAGAVLTAITKTGGDHFHGTIFGEWQPKAFIAKPHFATGPKKEYDRKQFGGDLGGPIIPGKLTFYAAFEGVNQKKPATLLNASASIPQNMAAEINGSIPQEFKQRLYFGKLTWFATPDDTVNLIGYKRDQSNLSDFGGNAPPSHGRLLQTEQTRFQLQWRHTAGNFLNFLNIAHDKANQGTPNVTSGPEFILTGSIAGLPDINNRQAFFGGNSSEQFDIEKSWTVRDDATYRAGDHTLKAGGEVTFYNLSRTTNDHFNATLFRSESVPAGPGGRGLSGQLVRHHDGRSVRGPDQHRADAHDQRQGYSGRALHRRRVEARRALDHQCGPALGFRKQRQQQGLCDPAGDRGGASVLPGLGRRAASIPKIISRTATTGSRSGVNSSRASASPTTSTATMILSSSAAPAAITTGACSSKARSNSSRTATSSRRSFCRPALAGRPRPIATIPMRFALYVQSLGTGGSVWVLPNKLKMPYSDQFDLGVRKRFGDIQASLTYSHVESHNLFMYARANFFSNGWYTRFLIKDAAGNVIGCTNGGDAWVNDSIASTNYPALSGDERAAYRVQRQAQPRHGQWPGASSTPSTCTSKSRSPTGASGASPRP